MLDRCAAFVAIGSKARQELAQAEKSFRKTSDDAILVNSNSVDGMTDKQASRCAKVNLLEWTQNTEQIAYMDADTRTYSDIGAAFGALDNGFDLCVCPSKNQGSDAFWHIAEDERFETVREVGYVPLQIQCGVMFVRRDARTEMLFNEWAHEWQRWQNEDQAAFVRALHKAPVRMWLLGYPWNGGAVIGHRFGACR